MTNTDDAAAAFRAEMRATGVPARAAAAAAVVLGVAPVDALNTMLTARVVEAVFVPSGDAKNPERLRVRLVEDGGAA